MLNTKGWKWKRMDKQENRRIGPININFLFQIGYHDMDSLRSINPRCIPFDGNIKVIYLANEHKHTKTTKG